MYRKGGQEDQDSESDRKSSPYAIVASETETDESDEEDEPSPELLAVLNPPARRESVFEKVMDQLSVIARKASNTPSEMVKIPNPAAPVNLPKSPEVTEKRTPDSPASISKDKKKGLKNKLSKKLSSNSIKRMGSLKKKEKPKISK